MTDYNARGTIGDNSAGAGQLDLMEKAKADIDIAIQPLIASIEKRLASVERAKCSTQEEAGMVTDLAAMLASSMDAIDRAHAQAKSTYLEAGRVVDGIAGGWRERLFEGRQKVLALLTAYQQAEAARIQAIRDAERAAEAEDPEPAFVAHRVIDAVKVTTRGDLGAKATLENKLQIDKVDVKKLPKRFLERPKVLAVIEAEAKVLIRAGEKVTGVVSSFGTKSTVRRGG